MRKEEFYEYPDGEKDWPENSSRCYFQWGWCPSATLDLHWTCITIPLSEWKHSVASDEFQDWCCENINTRWTLHSRDPGQIKFYFEDENIAFLFKLTWR